MTEQGERKPALSVDAIIACWKEAATIPDFREFVLGGGDLYLAMIFSTVLEVDQNVTDDTLAEIEMAFREEQNT